MTYEYVCTECGHQWEAEQRISEPALSDCPSCKRSAAKRLVTGGMGFVLKGSGWYSDLYGLKPKGAGGGGDLSAPKSTPSSAKESSGTDASSTESKSGASETTTSSTKKESSASAA